MLIITPSTPAMPARQRGFTLGELTVVLVVVSSLSMGYITWKQNVLEDLIIQKTADGITLLQEALYGYRMDAAHGYSWPAVISDLDPYLPNFAGGGRNGVGQPYRIDPPPPPALPTDGLTVETEMLTAAQAQAVARRFPLTGTTTGKIVRVGVPVPGHEEARDALLARDGSKDMLGDLAMGGNNIGGANQLQSAFLTVSDEITLDDRTLHKIDVQLLRDIAALDCREGAMRMTGGVASCVTLVTRCRMCVRARSWSAIHVVPGWGRGCKMNPNGWFAVGPRLELCTGWSDAPAWTSSVSDDTGNTTGGCNYHYYMQCDGRPRGAAGRPIPFP